MSDIKWIKLSVDMFDDEKIKLIRSMPEGNAILVIWIQLLSLAGKTNDSGMIYIARHMAYSEEMLATIFDHPLNTVRLALNTLASFGLLEVNPEGVINITNWEKHQNVEGMERVRKLTAERNRKYRERKKLEELPVPKSDVSVTSRDATEEELDIDKEIDKESRKDTIQYSEIINYLNKKTGKNFKNVESNKKFIRARWNEGYRMNDFKKVIDNKVQEWKGITFANGKLGDTYLKPSTLFASKFDEYLNSVPNNPKQKSVPNKSEVKFFEFEE